MKKIYLLEEFEFKQLQKGRTIEFGDGQAVALSPDVSTRDGVKPDEKKKMSKGMSKDQKQRMRKAIVQAKDKSYACRQCKEGGFKGVRGGHMHYMRNHVQGWRGK